MKLLIAYDGSNCSDAAIDDLVQAGLPLNGEALAVSVSEIWMPLPDAGSENSDPYLEELGKHYRQRGEAALAEAKHLADRAADRLKVVLPGWEISSEASYGSPAWEVLSTADKFGADLIVVGSHGQSAISRIVIGSISQKILTEAFCSVRVARGRVDVDPSPQRLVIGFDNSKGAEAAVDAVASRRWMDGSQVRLVSVLDPVKPSLIGRLIPPVAKAVDEINESEVRWIEEKAESALAKLRNAGLDASLHLLAGNPKRLIVEEAEHWSADCIFVGANKFGSRVERFLLGATSSAVAARAHCSVEVVRKMA
jgi:nucleotide-binding universal stress UspA family protein